ncbi:hypothetical protein ACQHIV_15390 [Kribbella sp. GL6]|uniref:hypothetical protein n=1 Tax=Kribbella sp. GL6 TaxID=3419765 RepID=UPI003D088076
MDRVVLPGLALSAALVAVLTGALLAVSPVAAVGLVAVAGVVVVVWRRPATAAYLIIGLTPTLAGIDRGRLIPALRPNEGLAVFLTGILVVRFLFRYRPGTRLRIQLNPIEVTLVALAVTSSVLPLAWMHLVGRPIIADDISYALVMWKFLGVYGIVRAAVHTQAEVRRCLLAAVAAAGLLGTLGILQSLDMLGVRSLLLTYWAPFGYADALSIPRGSSTLALPAATADVLIFSLAIAVGLLWKRQHNLYLTLFLAGASVVCVVGVFAAGEFSCALGLVVAIVCLTAGLRRLDLLRYAPVGLGVALIAAWPAVSHRLVGFQSASGWPNSWIVRWYNLSTYFWPDLFSGQNVLFGVRPSARVVVPTQGTGYVWIESGYTWLLWGGGIPLFAAFVALVWVSLPRLWRQTEGLRDESSVAALAAFTAITAIVAMMIFDPHLTYRGAADLLFSLLALTFVKSPDITESTESPTKASRGRMMELSDVLPTGAAR